MSAQAVDYAREDRWLCRPGRADVCAADVSVTRIDAAGRPHLEPASTRRPRDVDCFYVYPTVSLDPGANSDLSPDRAERGMTEAQFAPFHNQCRTFAPIYRQMTLTALRKVLRGGAPPGDGNMAYADVRAAWQQYVAKDNQGRPFVLIGHSQGSSLLKRLIAEEIDGKPIGHRMLSAILPGTTVLVPQGHDIGGDFRTVPLCRRNGQIGCVLTWASYRADPPPPANALFGVSRQAGLVAGCTNPARLAGGMAMLDTRLGAPWWKGGVAQYAPPARRWRVAGKAIATRYVVMPGLLSGACTTTGSVSYLSVRVANGIAPNLAQTVTGTATIGDADYPDWGFHVVDMAIVQGDLLRLIARQRRTYVRSHSGAPPGAKRGSAGRVP